MIGRPVSGVVTLAGVGAVPITYSAGGGPERPQPTGQRDRLAKTRRKVSRNRCRGDGSSPVEQFTGCLVPEEWRWDYALPFPQNRASCWRWQRDRARPLRCCCGTESVIRQGCSRILERFRLGLP